jgi:hypothetical protein
MNVAATIAIASAVLATYAGLMARLLSRAAAERLGMLGRGLVRVRVERL